MFYLRSCKVATYEPMSENLAYITFSLIGWTFSETVMRALIICLLTTKRYCTLVICCESCIRNAGRSNASSRVWKTMGIDNKLYRTCLTWWKTQQTHGVKRQRCFSIVINKKAGGCLWLNWNFHETTILKPNYWYSADFPLSLVCISVSRLSLSAWVYNLFMI